LYRRLRDGKSDDFYELKDLPAKVRTILLDAATVLFLEHHVCFRESDPLNSPAFLIFPESCSISSVRLMRRSRSRKLRPARSAARWNWVLHPKAANDPFCEGEGLRYFVWHSQRLMDRCLFTPDPSGRQSLPQDRSVEWRRFLSRTMWNFGRLGIQVDGDENTRVADQWIRPT
jgi:hypothetical protein